MTPASARLSLLAAAAAVALGASLTSGPAGAAAADGDVVIDPVGLARGTNTSVLHTAGHTIVDGDRTVSTDLAGRLRLVGRSEHGYVVITSDPIDARSTVWRVRRDGTARKLRALSPRATEPQTSPDGRRVAWTVPGRERSRLLVARTTDGSLVGSVVRKGYLDVADVGRRVLLSGGPPHRTLWFRAAAGTTERLLDNDVWQADVSADRAVVAVRELENGYDGICLSYRSLRDSSTRFWRSCTDKPLAFSPDRALMVTTDIASDGIGPGHLQVRDATTNTALATYTTDGGYFGQPVWEDADSFIVRVWTAGHAAQVRITTAGVVERVSRVATVGSDNFRALWWTFPNG